MSLSPWLLLAAAAALCAVLPATVYLFNLAAYRPPSRAGDRRLIARPLPPVSVLIPARDEAASIRGAVESVLASRGVELEVVVLDDGSRDATPAIVRELAAADPRVRLETAPPLPAGWCGKQHACAVLATRARHDVLAFLDADVRLLPEGLAGAVGFLETSGAALVSGIPRQLTGTLAERLLIPLIHFILLGFLPLRWMRAGTFPGFGAGCGQLFVARRAAYWQAGGHMAIRASLHDGLKLPRAFRRAGFRTDLFDATDVATCRMYDGFAATWRGLAKNATEGLAAPAAIVPWTLLLALGQVAPPLLLLLALLGLAPPAVVPLAALATAAVYLPRLHAARRFHQPWTGAILHPLGVTLLLAIQWHALTGRLMGRPASWRGRAYGPPGPARSVVPRQSTSAP